MDSEPTRENPTPQSPPRWRLAAESLVVLDLAPSQSQTPDQELKAIRKTAVHADAIRQAIRDGRLPEVEEAVAAFQTIGLHLARPADPQTLPQIIRTAFQTIQSINNPHPPRHHLLPTTYNGPDLLATAQALRLDPETLVRLHSETTYTVATIGFCPGFPYLAHLPKPLQGLRRLPTPRAQVPPGSVAIVDDLTAVYPLPRPGGWRLIGQTDAPLLEPRQNQARLAPGDTVQFQNQLQPNPQPQPPTSP